MDLVLGLAMTSRAVRWVLVEGTTGEGDPVDRGAITIDGVETYDPEGLLRGLVDDTAVAGVDRIHAIGLTWTCDAAPVAGTILQALDARGLADVVSVSEVEAAGLLASGIAEIAALDNVAVCVIESDAAVAATVTPDAVSADRIDRSPDDPDSAELIDNLKAVLEESTGGRTEAIFVLGSECDDTIVSALDAISTVPVISAAESDLAFARGAALAAALAVNTQYGQAASGRRLHLTKVGVLTSVLVAASVTLVVATTAAVGIKLHPGAVAPVHEIANVSEEAPAASPPVPKAVPKPRPAAPPPAAPSPPAARPPAPAAPPPAPVVEAATEPAYDPPAYVPPAAPPPAPEPAYVPPPPPPGYVPPPPPPVQYPQPRLRDRIIERIPIIGRFHEPKPW